MVAQVRRFSLEPVLSIVLGVLSSSFAILGVVVFLFRRRLESWGLIKERDRLSHRYFLLKDKMESLPPGMARVELFDLCEKIRYELAILDGKPTRGFKVVVEESEVNETGNQDKIVDITSFFEDKVVNKKG